LTMPDAHRPPPLAPRDAKDSQPLLPEYIERGVSD
jgi:hypothetical protein